MSSGGVLLREAGVFEIMTTPVNEENTTAIGHPCRALLRAGTSSSPLATSVDQAHAFGT